MEQIQQEKVNQEYTIIPIFKDKGKDIETVITETFIKYIKYNDYK